MNRRSVFNSLLPAMCAGTLLATTAMPAYAQQPYPAKTIRFLVGAPPGGSNDLFARAIGQQLSPALGQQVVVDNRPGANQMIAADIMAKSPADGHTIYITSTSFTTGAALQPKLPLKFHPQHVTFRSRINAQVCSQPVVTWVTSRN